mmetsp:Transcript_40782/g.122870  ORF Transcript_40782/g.122870 Transcript_40782/m.122870 type:complete len:451 (-) Transcript_40782:304-1656(-)
MAVRTRRRAAAIVLAMSSRLPTISAFQMPVASLVSALRIDDRRNEMTRLNISRLAKIFGGGDDEPRDPTNRRYNRRIRQGASDFDAINPTGNDLVDVFPPPNADDMASNVVDYGPSSITSNRMNYAPSARARSFEARTTSLSADDPSAPTRNTMNDAPGAIARVRYAPVTATTSAVPVDQPPVLRNSANDATNAIVRPRANSFPVRTTSYVPDESLLCPISSVLPLDPVQAEDGFTYERSAIENLIKKKVFGLRSPVTGERMGPKLVPNDATRNAIEQLVRNGSISGAVAQPWTKLIIDQDALRLAYQGVENGDTVSMCRLGNWYSFGQKGLVKDKSEGYAWYMMAADYGSSKGMTYTGICLLTGEGVKANEAEGMMLLGAAAQGGSDLAAYWLGVCYKDGSYGLPQSDGQAMVWLQRIVNKKARTGSVDAPFNHVQQLLAEMNGYNVSY